jgi:hypothetical protein
MPEGKAIPMLICVTYKIPVSVYVDTKAKSVWRVVVDDEARLDCGSVDYATFEDGAGREREVWSNKITPASQARLVRAHEAVQADCEAWPSWEFGY